MGAYRPKPLSQQEAVLERRLRDIESGEWQERVERARRLGLPPPIGGGMPIKDRFGIAAGLPGSGGQQSSWEIPDLVEFDYSLLNQAAAGHALGTLLGITPGTNAAVIGSPDPIGPSLASAVGNRVAGSGANQYATLLSAWVFARTQAGAIYVPANTPTLQLIVVSAGGSAQATDNLTAALTLNAGNLPNFWNMFTLTVPSSRQFGSIAGAQPAGSAVTTAAALFYGDVLFSDLNTSVALNVQGNHLVVILELA